MCLPFLYDLKFAPLFVYLQKNEKQKLSKLHPKVNICDQASQCTADSLTTVASVNCKPRLKSSSPKFANLFQISFTILQFCTSQTKGSDRLVHCWCRITGERSHISHLTYGLGVFAESVSVLLPFVQLIALFFLLLRKSETTKR